MPAAKRRCLRQRLPASDNTYKLWWYRLHCPQNSFMHFQRFGLVYRFKRSQGADLCRQSGHGTSSLRGEHDFFSIITGSQLYGKAGGQKGNRRHNENKRERERERESLYGRRVWSRESVRFKRWSALTSAIRESAGSESLTYKGS